MEEFKIQQTVFLRRLDVEFDMIFSFPLRAEALQPAPFSEVGVDEGMCDEGKALLDGGSQEELQARLYLVDHHEALLI